MALALCGAAPTVLADCIDPVAHAVSVQGTVAIQRAGTQSWNGVELGQGICVEDTVRVSTNSRAVLRLEDHTTLPLDEDSIVRVAAPTREGVWWLELLRGAVHVISRAPRELGIRTPFVNAAVEGTEFFVRADESDTEVRVFDGIVQVGEGARSIRLISGESAVAGTDGVPRPVQVLNPRDAVQWALYYPPIFDLRADGTNASAAPAGKALADYRQGRVADALATLERTPMSARDGNWAVTSAAMLLSIGRVDQARGVLARVSADDPARGDALAVESIIALVTGEATRAGEIVERAVAAAPTSPTPLVARSYVEQARFDLPAARASLFEATRLAPEDPLAWARLAELQQSLGDWQAGLAAAHQAEALDPRLSRTQTVLGFAHLTGMQAEAAARAFREAIRLDSADPLPRLGLGIARIRRGALEEGRGEIEIAASLDPNNSLMRSYLGKAYYEEKRDVLAGSELAIAKSLDPSDPTPWFYDAIRKQTENRPVEALSDLQRSIELNDNRAVYRSRLLLDEDLAARSASLARIYQDLGFDQLALLEGYRSLAIDPGNFSAHRLLADAYSSVPRHEVAQVSELRQAQLLAPMSLQQLQPQLAATNLGVLEGAGPPTAAINEYNRLFVRDGARGYLSGVYGDNGTRGADLGVSGIHGPLGVNFARFAYRTEGFRPNNDLKHEINQALLQFNPAPEARFQIDVRSQNSDHGDLDFRFDLFEPRSGFNPGFRRSLDLDTTTLSGVLSPAIGHDLVASVSYQTVSEQQFPAEFIIIPIETDGSAVAGELQHRGQYGSTQSIVGLSSFRQDAEVFVPGPGDQVLDAEFESAYGYGYFDVGKDVSLTVGLSNERFQDQNIERNLWNPKLGVVWRASNATTLRAGAGRTIKQPLLGNASLEPTQLAGFNQLYDDLNGSLSRQFGIALNQRFGDRLHAGLEFSYRQIDTPRSVSGDTGDLVVEDRQDEREHRAYLYWAPSSRFTLGAEYVLEKFERDSPTADFAEAAFTGPVCDLTTHRLPLSLTAFPGGPWYARARWTGVRQEVEYGPRRGGGNVPECVAGGPRNQRDDDFGVVDLELGYRLPKRAGSLSLTVLNILDEEFSYQDRNFQTASLAGTSLTPQFSPERAAYFRLAFDF